MRTLIRSFAVVLNLVALAACGGDGSTTPTTAQPQVSDVACATPTGGTIAPNALQGVVVDCSQGGNEFDLAGGGASYLIVPEFAVGDVAIAQSAYTIGVGSAATRVAAPTPTSPGAFAMVTRGSPSAVPHDAQRAFDLRLREWERRAVRAGQLHTLRDVASGARVGAKAVSVPAVGSERDFHVIASFSSANQTFKSVGARLAYVGANILLYIDTLSASNGLSPQSVADIGTLFDQTLVPIDLAAFGQPSDIDGNGHLVMLMSPTVNALTNASDCQTKGFIAGFFTGYDLASSSTNSNHGEVFYTIAPDPAGTSSCSHSVSEIERIVPATFLHEMQHLINFSQHVVVRGARDAEEGWLDEGLSIVAEELGSRYYERRFPNPSGRTNPSQLFPDSSQGFIGGLLSDSYSFLLHPDTATVTLHTDADDGLAWRGAVWLLVRWLGDQKGEGIFQRLEHTTLTGTANIAAAAGEPFEGLFGDFGLSLYTDSLVGIARSQVPSRDRFATRNLRQMYAALFHASGGTAGVPLEFPISLTSLGASQTVQASMEPGTASFYRLDTTAGAANVRVHFSRTAGGALPASLHPQVAVFRLPPGA